MRRVAAGLPALLTGALFAAAIAPEGLQAAESGDYGLNPQQIAPGTYLLEGVNEDFSFDNGGNIVNTGFVVTEDGVVVINTGPSFTYGQQMREAIAGVTDQPVVRVYISKLHPDHFLGNQAFADVPVHTLAKTREGIESQGEQFTDNMYRMVGNWMLGTELAPPTATVASGRESIGGHDFEFIEMAGHTPSDLVVLDHTTGVLFAGGVVFHDRAPTTPHADIELWLQELDRLEQVPFEILVPSHGPVSSDAGPIEQTRHYLLWLRETLQTSAEAGLDMGEVMESPLPDEVANLAVMPVEFHRSVSHLYPDFEQAVIPKVTSQTR